MNFAERFDQKLSHDSPVSIGGERFSFESKPVFIQHHDSSKVVIVPDAHLLFSGEYVRIGSDLIISSQDQKFVVGNYFKGENRPSLASKDGATLSGHIIDAMTGHVHYAQANAPAVGQVIGHVLKLSGSATAIRNGVSITLNIGDAVQKGDVVQTGADSSIGMTFVDGSAFGMTSNARMVLNEMIFDPNGSSNSSLISLVQGTITFVAGQTAKNGNMRVETPVATMGIRGTAVLVEIAANDGPTKFSVLVEPDGHTGSYNLYDKVSGQLIGTVSQAGQVTFVSSLGLGQPPTAVEQLKTLQDQQAEKAIIQQVFQLYFPNYNPDSNPNSTKHGSTSGNNLAEIIIGTATFNGQTAITQIELRFEPTNPNAGGNGGSNRVFYNTKATFSADAVTSEQSFITLDKTFKFSEVVHINDPDIGNAPFYDIPTPFVAGSAVIKTAVSTIPFLDEGFLTPLLQIDQTTGVVSFDRLKFNFLGEGESATFEIQVLALSGPDSAHVIIPVTITGSNDAPTIVAGESVIVGGVIEDANPVSLATNGVITFQDVDLTDTHSVTTPNPHDVAPTSTSSSLPGFVSNTTKIGTFTIDPVSEIGTDTNDTGTVAWHFTLPDNDPTLQSLSVGQTITQVYTITISDQHGVQVPQTVTVTITGTNDAPVLATDVAPPHPADEVFNTTNSTVEDIATGSLTFTDIDLSDTHQVSAALNTGANAIVWSGGLVSGIPADTLAALATAMTALVLDSTTTGTGSISWTFKIPDHFLDFLADKETLTLVYDITVKDYYNNMWTGTYSTKQVSVQIGAANDQPVITAIDTVVAVKEDLDLAAGNLLAKTGSVTFTDTDLTDTHQAHAVYNNDAEGHNGGFISPDLATALATALTVPSSSLAVNDHDFEWNFALDNSLVQYLAENETITLSYTITVQDSSGISANDTSTTKIVNITITGTNDTPTITTADPSAVAEGNTGTPDVVLVAVVDQVTISDVDTNDVRVPYVANTLAFDVDHSSGPEPAGGTLADLFTVNAADGTISYDKAAFDYLAGGEHVVVTFTFDASSGPDTVPQSITITIDGVNDAPVIAVTSPPAVTEGDTGAPDVVLVTVADQVSISDVDASDVHVFYVTDTLAFDADHSSGPEPAGGTLADLFTVNAADGTISYDKAAFDYLAAGEHVTLTFTFDASSGPDTVPQSITITIDGVNDAPVIAVTNPPAVTEGDTGTPDVILVTLADQVSISDVDASDVHVPYVADTLAFDADHSSGPEPAGHSLADLFTLDITTGTISYDKAAFDYLAAGEHVTATFTFDASSGPDAVPQSITITIDGENDAPAIVVTNPLAVEEGNTGTPDVILVTLADQVLISDVDASDVHVPYVADTLAFDADHSSGPVPAGHSLADLFTLDITSGTISYDKAAFDYLAAGDHVTATFTFNASSGPDTILQSITVTIDGANDAPLANADNLIVAADAFDTSGTPTLSISDALLLLNDKDVDGDALTVGSVEEGNSSTGTVTHDGANVVYSRDALPGANAQVLDAFMYKAADATDSSGNAMVNLTIVGPDNPGQHTFTLAGTAADEIFVGSAGADTFVFATGFGHDIITNFDLDQDVIKIDGVTQSIMDLYNHATSANGGADALITPDAAGHPADTILLKGVTVQQLQNHNLIV